MRGKGKWLDLLIRLFMVLAAFLVVIWFLLAMNFWAGEWKEKFLFNYLLTGENLLDLIYITLFLLALSFILKKLLVWEVRAALRPEKRRPR